MQAYLLHRLIHCLIVLLVMSFAVYGLIGLMPGDPIDLMFSANPDMTAADAERLRALYGLDVPIYERYISWLGAALSGDFGFSRLYAVPVIEALGPALLETLKLLGLSFFFSLLIAFPIAIWAASRPYSKSDYAINLTAFAGISIPPFWLALLLMMVFSVSLGWLPAGGIARSDAGFWEETRHLILPVAALTLASVGGHVRFIRAAMIEALRQDYIRTAHAKGVSPRRVIWGHALRNALIPVVTIIALDFGTLFSGALITETVFARPGMGKMLYDAIMGNDYNLALVGLLLATAVTLSANLLADIIYTRLDPRITLK